MVYPSYVSTSEVCKNINIIYIFMRLSYLERLTFPSVYWTTCFATIRLYNSNTVFRHLWVKGSHSTVTHNKSEWFLIFFPSTILLRPCRNNYERSKETVFYQHICVCHSGQINTILLFLKNRSQRRLNNDLCFHFAGVFRKIQQNIQIRVFWKAWKWPTAFTSYTNVALRNITGQFRFFNRQENNKTHA